MYNVEEWAEIRRLHFSEKLGIKTIARRLGVARNTVREAVRSERPPAYRRDRPGSAVDAVEEEIRRLLRDTPDMPASVIAERIGWERGMTVLRQRVAELRPAYRLADPCQRTEYRPGEIGQYDLWFPPVDIPVAHDEVARPPVFVGVSCYSRFIAARMIPTRQAHDVLGGHLHCLRRFGATPRTGVYDQEPAIGRWRGAKATFTQEFAAFRGLLGMGAVLCARADPEAKGVVERANRYLETSFLPGRRFADPDDFNAQLEGWLVKANHRVHETTRARPSERIWEDRGAMVALPPVLPDPALRFGVLLGRDHYVRADTNDYSVHPRFIGRRVEVRVGLDEVVVTCGTEEAARHRRSWASHRTLTDAAHARARSAMRELAAAGRAPEAEVESRDLADYDRALGVA